uniref:hypothetical protein n=2 Tax=Leptospira interrogans TaxID=173 RepID=UPI000366F0EC
ETGTKRKVKSLASWPFLFQERSFKTFDQQTTVLRSVKEKPDINVWLFAFLARVITERHQSYIQDLHRVDLHRIDSVLNV